MPSVADPVKAGSGYSDVPTRHFLPAVAVEHMMASTVKMVVVAAIVVLLVLADVLLRQRSGKSLSDFGQRILNITLLLLGGRGKRRPSAGDPGPHAGTRTPTPHGEEPIPNVAHRSRVHINFQGFLRQVEVDELLGRRAGLFS